jgi:nitrate/nitrite transport system ATP-binding protein
MSDKNYLSLSQVDMTFVSGTSVNPVLKGIDLTVQRGEYISLIGHSGCGKSTVLNIVAGLLRATSGGVLLDNKEVNAPGPDRAVVFQNHSLLPWLTVYQNVELAVDKIFRGVKSAAERKEWILHNLAMVNMSHALDRLPSQISGGMKQRVGIARALAMEPKVLLLDEPFGALDALTRAHLQDEVIRIQSELGNTVMMITHDVDEAVLMSDRVVMMTNGPAATIGQVMPVDLPRPRNRIELAEDPTYNHCRQEILKFLYEKQRKVEPIAARVAKPAAATRKEAALRA